MSRIDEIKARLEEVQQPYPLPWRIAGLGVRAGDPEEHPLGYPVADCEYDPAGVPAVDFIANAPTDIAYLLEALEDATNALYVLAECFERERVA